MKSSLYFLFVVCVALTIASCKSVKLPSSISDKAAIKYTIQGEEGTNGSAVAYIPERKQYVCVIAGNVSYPLEIFDATGKSIANGKAGVDSRGLWYNPNTKQIEGNGYDDTGIYSYSFSTSGEELRSNIEMLRNGMIQPNDQVVGVYDPDENEILYLEGDRVIRYSRSAFTRSGSLGLDIPSGSNVNETTLGYTGIPKAELCLLDHSKKELLFFDKATGNFTKSIALPASFVTDSWFRWSFANGRVWSYDVMSRTWTGYVVFKAK